MSLTLSSSVDIAENVSKKKKNVLLKQEKNLILSVISGFILGRLQ